MKITAIDPSGVSRAWDVVDAPTYAEWLASRPGHPFVRMGTGIALEPGHLRAGWAMAAEAPPSMGEDDPAEHPSSYHYTDT